MQTGTGPAGRAGVAQTIDELDLGVLARAIWGRKRLIIGLTLLAAAIAFAAVNYVTPRYKSEVRVLIETRENIFLRPEADRSTERAATVDQEAVTSQVQLILSRGLALDVIRNLKLGEKPEFDPVLRGPSAIRTVLAMTGLVRDPMSQTPEERVLKSYMDRLTAFQVDKSRVIAIEFESQDPELAAQVVNAVADGFVMLQQTARQEQARDAAVVLLKEIEKLAPERRRGRVQGGTISRHHEPDDRHQQHHVVEPAAWRHQCAGRLGTRAEIRCRGRRRGSSAKP